MSMQAISAVRDYAEARGSALSLLQMIADGIDPQKDGMFGRNLTQLAGLAHLYRFDATETQVVNAERRCRRLLHLLVDSGELIILRGNGRVRSAYHIPILPGEPGYDPQDCSADDHDCCGFHTPLTISREELHREEVQARKEADRDKILAQRANAANAAEARERRKNQGSPDDTDEGGPISPPSAREGLETPPGRANKPPQGGPISPPREGLETPPGRANKPPRLYKEKSHKNPSDNPSGIPGASSSLKNAPSDETISDTPPLAAFRAHYPDVTAFARKTGRRWYATARENVDTKDAYWMAEIAAHAAQASWERNHAAHMPQATAPTPTSATTAH